MTWHLERDGEIIAELTPDGGDFPWLHGTLAARPEFEELRPVFASRPTVPYERVAALYASLRLLDDGDPVPGFVLVVDGDRVAWRWSAADEG